MITALAITILAPIVVIIRMNQNKEFWSNYFKEK